MQDEHPDVGSRVTCGERLAVGPDATDRVAGARIVLGDDQRLHVQDLCFARVRRASMALV